MKKALQNISVALASIILSILLVEVVLKMIGYPQLTDGPYVEHRTLGWRLRPNFKGIYHRTEDKIETKIHINSNGLRDREYGEKGANTFRILALGDSFTEAFQVELQDTYIKVLEKLLNQNKDKGYEVINAGTGVYGNDQELQFLKENIQTIQPDLVLVGFCMANDIIDNLVGPGRIQIKNGFPEISDEFYQKIYGEIQINDIIPQRNPQKDSFILFFKDLLKRHSHFYRFLSMRYHQLLLKWGGRLEKQELRPEERTAAIYNRSPKIQEIAREHLNLPFMYANVYSPRGEEGIKITKEILKAISKTAHLYHAKTVIVLIPTPLSVHPDVWERWVRLLQLDRNKFDFRKPHDILMQFGKENGIPMIDLLPRFLEAGKRERLYFDYDDHWNVNGHRLAGEEIYQFLKRKKFH